MKQEKEMKTKKTNRKSWTEKLNDSKDLPKIVKLNAEGAKKWGGKTMAIPSPIEVNEIMKGVKKGKIITINDIREKIAEKYKTDIACPITTGIFAWISANAAEEERKAGKKKITPYWRTIKSTGELNDKYPGGMEAHKRALLAEGHEIVKKGKKYLVVK
jgi:hypothetical protein